MISRRNIRVKVMQTLYAIDSASGNIKQEEAILILTKKIQQSRQLFTYLIYFITEVARYSETDARQKAGKHLPTAGDLTINTKIAGNELLWKIVEDSGFKAAINEFKLSHVLDTDLVKRTYVELAKSPDYE